MAASFTSIFEISESGLERGQFRHFPEDIANYGLRAPCISNIEEALVIPLDTSCLIIDIDDTLSLPPERNSGRGYVVPEEIYRSLSGLAGNFRVVLATGRVWRGPEELQLEDNTLPVVGRVGNLKKPKASYYRRIESITKLGPDVSCVIGDHPNYDLRGAYNFGSQAVIIPPFI